jgi:hypothetical protein
MKRSIEEVSQTELRIDEICEVVLDIRAMPGTAKQRMLSAQKKYPEFEKRYPFLFEKACADDFDMERFTYMVGLKMKIDQNQISHHDASVEVGQNMYDHYIAEKI